MSNYSSNKKIAINTLVLYIRSIVIMLIALYTSRVVLQVLGVDDYGIYNVVGGVVAVFSMFSSTLSAASQRFITYALGKGDIHQLKIVFSTSVLLHFVLGVIVVLLLEFLGAWFLNNRLNIPVERLCVAKWVFQFSILTFFINVISLPYNAVIIAHEKMKAFAYISIVDGFLKLIVALILPFFPWDKLLIYAILQSIVAIMVRLMYYVYCARNFKESRSVKCYVDGSLFKEMFAFSGWNLFGSGSLVLRNQGVDILLNLFFGVTVNAAKGISNQVQNAVHQFVTNFTSSITPQLTKSVAQENFERTKMLMFHGSRLSFFLMMIFVVPIMTYTKETLSIWLVDVPDYTVDMVRLVLVCMLCESISRFLTNTILAFGEIKIFQLTVGVLKLLAIPITYIFLKRGGSPLTGIWVNILLELLCFGGRLFFAKRKLTFDVLNFVWNVFVLCWISFFVCFLISFTIYKGLDGNFFVGVGTSLIATILCVVLSLKKKERDVIKNAVRRKMARK